MDESWRMRMGMDPPPFPAVARKSMDEYTTRRSSATTVKAEDFSDVFGGPPRSILTPKFSGDFSCSYSFYDEIFGPPEFGSRKPPSHKAHGQSLPAFRIPASDDRFYGDIFGSVGEFASSGGGGVRMSRERSWMSSKAKSKSNSSSVLSYEDVSPLCPAAASAVGDDVALSSFASKLRPINVPSRHKPGRKQGMPAFLPTSKQSFFEQEHAFSRRTSSPETISLDPNSFRSIKLSTDDMRPSSPASSPVSSVCQEAEQKPGCGNYEMKGEEEEVVEEIEEDEAMSSYVIEIGSDHHNCREGGGESIDIDEVIAWAKERFQRWDHMEEEVKTESDQRGKVSAEGSCVNIDRCGMMKSSSMEEEQSNWRTGEERETSEEQIEMELLDEDIRLWSTGKETNIMLLLSTLHHILWPSSGWYALPLANLKEASQVKKAYQKARLCLHPDKLQQRGATLPQKYVAEKAFSILQEAWGAYISQDGFLH